MKKLIAFACVSLLSLAALDTALSQTTAAKKKTSQSTTAKKKTATQTKKKSAPAKASTKTAHKKTPATAGKSTKSTAKKSTPVKKSTSSAKKSSSAASSKGYAARTGSSTRKTSSRRTSRRSSSRARVQPAPTAERYREIQQALADRGYLAPEAVTGKWGSGSIEAMKKFEGEQNLKPDGKIDALSLLALDLAPKRNQLASQSKLQAEPAPESESTESNPDSQTKAQP